MTRRCGVVESGCIHGFPFLRLISILLLASPLAVVMVSHPAFGQTPTIVYSFQLPAGAIKALTPEDFSVPLPTASSDSPFASSDPGSPTQTEGQGPVRRGIARTIENQKELYRAPFQRSNLKWDLLVLTGTGALIATDRHIERHLPGGNVDIYGNVSNIALSGTAGALAVFWGYGLKTHNEHLKEMGLLEMEALVNTFLIYTPMQVIAGRQRPGEGNGYGDFWRHHNIDTSFPAGHPMFTIAMASVAAHEYPKPWVKALAYGAAAAVMGGRLLGRDHWTSDVFVGSTLGYFIGSHIFHSHCNPAFSKACHAR